MISKEATKFLRRKTRETHRSKPLALTFWISAL
jgi:hypothetical protein